MRRTLMTGALALVACGVTMLATATGAAASTPANSPWAQTNGNAALNRANLTEATLTPGNVGKVHFRRSIVSPPATPHGDFVCFDAIAAPVLTGGFLYAVVGDKLTRTNAATGKVSWSVAVDPSHTEDVLGIAVSNGVVVLDSADCISQSDPNRLLRAFNAATGGALWAGASGNSGLGNIVVSNGYVVMGSSAPEGTEYTAFRLSSGAVAWAQQANCVTDPTVAVVDALVVHQTCNDSGSITLVGDRLATGTRAWTQAAGGVVQAGDLDSTSGRNVFVSSGGDVKDLNPATGKARYTLAGAKTVLAVAGTRLVATCANDSGSIADVCSYDLTTGARQWRQSSEGAPKLVALADGVLYLDNGDALRSTTGAVLADVFDTSNGPATALVVGDGRVAVSSSPRILDFYGLAGS